MTNLQQLTLEMGNKVSSYVCDCCGATVERSHGFLYLESKPYAVYYALWAQENPEGIVEIAVVNGDWEAEELNSGAAFCLEARFHEGRIQLRAADAEAAHISTLLQNAGLIRGAFSREQALARPEMQHVFDCAKSIVDQDERVIQFFRQSD